MPVTTDRIARLRGFGLSEYAARAYLALLDLGTTEARDVSSLSKVPASKIYHILDQLHEKGLVTVLPEFPRKYAPVPFGDYLRRLHDEHEAAARAIEAEMEALVTTFAVESTPPSGDRGGVTLLRGRRNVFERIGEAFAAARADALVLATATQVEDPRAWREPVEAARQRGVRVRALGALPGAEWRERAADLPDAAYALVVDGRHVVLGHALPDDGHPSDGNDTGLSVDQEGIVSLLASLLEARWHGAGASIPVRVDRPAAPVPGPGTSPPPSPP